MSNENIKTELKISLHAGGILVAESDDAALWQKVFAWLNNPKQSENISTEDITISCSGNNSPGAEYDSFEAAAGSDGALNDFAKALDISAEQIQGACAPIKEPPYMHLDGQYWESFFKKTPARGPASVSKMGLAATLLCLWFKYAKIDGSPTPNECQAVLKTIHERDNNPTRSINNSAWLQKRNKGIVVNPAKTSTAIEIARNYCVE